MKGYFANLPLSIYAGECFTFNQCSKLWDNTHACCGSNKHFEIDVQMDCGEQGDENYPVSTIKPTNVRLDTLKITEKFVGIKVKVATITSDVEEAVKSVLSDYLVTEPIFPGKTDGDKVGLVQFLNNNTAVKLAIEGYCWYERFTIGTSDDAN